MNRNLAKALVRIAALVSLGPFVMKIGEWLGYSSYHSDESELLLCALAIGLWAWSELSWWSERRSEKKQ